MPTYILAEGFEHGLLNTSGGGLFASYVSTPAVQNTYKRSGEYALRTDANSSTQVYATRNLTTAQSKISYRVYMYFVELPNGDCSLFYSTAGVGIYYRLRYNAATQNVCLYDGTTKKDLGGVVIDTWYRFDVSLDLSANPNVAKARMDGGEEQTFSTAQAATTTQRFDMGITSASRNGDVVFDDWVVTNDSADYPLGEGRVIGIRPDEDGTHNAGTDVMEDNDGNDIGVVPAYDHLSKNPFNTSPATYVKQVATGTGNYAEVLFENIDYTTVLGGMAYLQYMASSADADEGGCIIIDEDTTQTTLWGNPTTRADYSETSVFHKNVILPNPSGGWDKDAANALKARLGYSNNVTSVPYWCALLIQIAVSGEEEEECNTVTVVNVSTIVAGVITVVTMG